MMLRKAPAPSGNGAANWLEWKFSYFHHLLLGEWIEAQGVAAPWASLFAAH